MNKDNKSNKVIIKNLSKFLSSEKYNDEEIRKVLIKLFTK